MSFSLYKEETQVFVESAEEISFYPASQAVSWEALPSALTTINTKQRSRLNAGNDLWLCFAGMHLRLKTLLQNDGNSSISLTSYMLPVMWKRNRLYLQSSEVDFKFSWSWGCLDLILWLSTLKRLRYIVNLVPGKVYFSGIPGLWQGVGVP